MGGYDPTIHHPIPPMRLPFYVGLIGSLTLAWCSGGLIHRGQQAVNAAAQPAMVQGLR
jgi:hypothetical protein